MEAREEVRSNQVDWQESERRVENWGFNLLHVGLIYLWAKDTVLIGNINIIQYNKVPCP